MRIIFLLFSVLITGHCEDTCDYAYPKVFGASAGDKDTIFTALDFNVAKQVLAVGGSTLNSEHFGSAISDPLPLIVMYLGENYPMAWAKILNKGMY
jgi:hypothetical protein